MAGHWRTFHLPAGRQASKAGQSGYNKHMEKDQNSPADIERKVEHKIRHRLSHHPFIYALIGGVGVVLFWRGVWLTADVVMPWALSPSSPWIPRDPIVLLDGPITLLISIILLLFTGLFVSSLIGNEIIISGIKGEKRVEEKTEEEIKGEESEISRREKELRKMEQMLEEERKKK